MHNSDGGELSSSTRQSRQMVGLPPAASDEYAEENMPRRAAIVHGAALAAAAFSAAGFKVAVAAEPPPAQPKINPNVRRVVTSLDDHGRSHVLSDKMITAGSGAITQVWVTDQVPANNTGTKDNAERPIRLEPPPHGVNFFFFTAMPESAFASLTPEQREKNIAERFKVLGASGARVDTSRNVGMHKTKTVDYIILLSGEVDLLLDDGEVHLKPFDVVIQRGTNHAWVNRGQQRAILAAILIDAEPTGT